MKHPLFEQEDTCYILTREGRLALGLANDDDDDDWREREADARTAAVGGTGHSKENKKGKKARAEAADAEPPPPPPPPPRPVTPPPPPPKGWKWPLEGERIDVEVQADEAGEPTWVTAAIFAVLIDGTFGARIELPDLSDAWDDWFTWEQACTPPPPWPSIALHDLPRPFMTFHGLP